MWKLAFLVAAFAVSASPLDAKDDRRMERSGDTGARAADLRRDVERISREIYPPRAGVAAPARSFAPGAAPKKR